MVRAIRSKVIASGEPGLTRRNLQSQGFGDGEGSFPRTHPNKKARRDVNYALCDVPGDEINEEHPGQASHGEMKSDEEVEEYEGEEDDGYGENEDGDEYEGEENEDEEDEEVEEEEEDTGAYGAGNNGARSEEPTEEEEGLDGEVDDDGLASNKLHKKVSSAMKPSGESEANQVCVVCNRLDDRPMCHFYPDSEGKGEEIHVHMFCGKIAAISSTNKKPEYELVDIAAIRNKFGVSYLVAAALRRIRSSTAGGGKVFYLYAELVKALKQESEPENEEISSPTQEQSATARPRGRPRGSRNKPNTNPPSDSKSTAQGYTLVHGDDSNTPPPAPAKQRNKDLDVRRRACVCGNASCYNLLERWVELGDDMRCGYVSLPSWSSKNTDRAKVVNQFRELVFMNLKRDKRLAYQDGHVRKYVAFHHFETFMLLSGNKGLVEYVEPSVASTVGLDERYRITAGDNKGKYLPSPRRSFSEIVKEVESLEMEAKTTGEENVAVTSNDDSEVRLEGIDLTRLRHRIEQLPRNYEDLKVEAERTEKDLAIELKRKRDLEKELASTRKELRRIQLVHTRLKRMVKDLGTEVGKV